MNFGVKISHEIFLNWVDFQIQFLHLWEMFKNSKNIWPYCCCAHKLSEKELYSKGSYYPTFLCQCSYDAAPR